MVNKTTITAGLILFIIVLGCRKQKYVIMNSYQGRVLSKKDNNPILNAKIYVDKFAFNAFDTIETDCKGYFLIDGFEMPYKYLKYQNSVSPYIYVEKEGYIRDSFSIGKVNNVKLDTIDVGDFYLEPKE